jgi:hypothetical protein
VSRYVSSVLHRDTYVCVIKFILLSLRLRVNYYKLKSLIDRSFLLAHRHMRYISKNSIGDYDRVKNRQDLITIDDTLFMFCLNLSVLGCIVSQNSIGD